MEEMYIDHVKSANRKKRIIERERNKSSLQAIYWPTCLCKTFSRPFRLKFIVEKFIWRTRIILLQKRILLGIFLCEVF